jgi:hypothetical protein
MSASMSAFNLGDFTSMMTDSRPQLLHLARTAEQAERYEDMCQFMKALIEKSEPKKLDVEERNLFSVAYKFVIGTHRSSLRSLEGDSEGKDSPDALVTEYKKQVEMDLIRVCNEALDLLTDLIAEADKDENKNSEDRIFYLKMAADYYRYLAESVKSDASYKDKTVEYYLKAQAVMDNLAATHPTRLGLILNFSVCYYEILGEKQKACDLAKTAFDQAIAQLDDLPEVQYKDSTLIMQLLRDNLTLWTSDTDQDAE